MAVIMSQNGVIIGTIKRTGPQSIGTIKIGGKEYPYNQYGGMLFTTLNLDFAPDGIQIGAQGAPTTPAAWYPNNDETQYGWNNKNMDYFIINLPFL